MKLFFLFLIMTVSNLLASFEKELLKLPKGFIISGPYEYCKNDILNKYFLINDKQVKCLKNEGMTETQIQNIRTQNEERIPEYTRALKLNDKINSKFIIFEIKEDRPMNSVTDSNLAELWHCKIIEGEIKVYAKYHFID